MSISNYFNQGNLSKSSSVIECPSCATCFAIDGQQVSHIEEPIFHCSRCGHYFGLNSKKEEASKESSTSEVYKPVVEIEEHSINLQAEQLDLMAEDINPRPDFSSPNVSSPNVSGGDTWYKRSEFNFDDSSVEEDTTVKVDWPNASQIESSKFNHDFKAIEPKKYQDLKKPSYYVESESNYYLDLSELEDDLKDEVESVYLPPTQGLSKKNIFSRFFKSTTIDEHVEYIEIETVEDTENLSLLKPALIVLSFPILFAGFVAFWGFNIDKTPAILMSFFHFDTKLLATVAPSGLALTSLSPEIVTLDSGERAFRIKGDVINSTGNTFSNLTLEAKLFTKDNRELVRVIAPLDNALRDSDNISALNADSIERLQSELADQATMIQPNIKIPFSLVVPGVKGEEAWYSARIYSVVRI